MILAGSDAPGEEEEEGDDSNGTEPIPEDVPDEDNDDTDASTGKKGGAKSIAGIVAFALLVMLTIGLWVTGVFIIKDEEIGNVVPNPLHVESAPAVAISAEDEASEGFGNAEE